MTLVNGAYQLNRMAQSANIVAPKSYYNTGTITQTGTTVTITSGVFTSDMVGGLLVYGSTSGAPVPVMITAFISATQVTVATSVEVPNQLPFEIWYGGVCADANGNLSFLNYVPAGNGLIGGSSVGTYTALAGGGQTNATILTTQYCNVNVVATAADSVKLPANALVGSTLRVINNTANSMNVFPHVGGTINSGTLNAAVAQAGGASAIYVYYGSNNWVKM